MGLRLLSGIFAVTVCLASSAVADYQPTTIMWPGWEVSSSEDLFMGQKHTSYPLTHLFDGRADTAWITSGKKPATPKDCLFWIKIRPAKPLFIDSIRLMNGYNKSKALYRMNDRAVGVRVNTVFESVESSDGMRYASAGSTAVPLPNKMGWHRIDLHMPTDLVRRKVQELTIEVTDVRHGKVRDLCLSELELWDGAKKIDMAMPGVVVFTCGDECGCGTQYTLMRRDGTFVVQDHTPDMGTDLMAEGAAWGPDRRLVAGVELSYNRPTLWVVDAVLGRVTFEKRLPERPIAQIRWKDADTVEVDYEAARGRPAPVKAFDVPLTAPHPKRRGG